ncbi:MAG: DNA recombination/repair protein RecA, partial [Planctomycetaceae bacterium]|nr:DNA recombination/repair protein RecA [Planctomycetaceae bacterium]
FRVAEFDMLSSCGISWEGDVLDLAIAAGLLDRSGTWLSYGDIKLGQGREKARLYFMENPSIVNELADKLKQAHAGIPIDNEETANIAEED